MAEYVVDPELKQYATPRQQSYIDQVNATGSFRAAAKVLITSADTVRASIRRLELEAAARGYRPNQQHFPIQAPFVAKGYSTLRNMKTGEELFQWEKTKVDDQLRAAAILAAFETAAVPLPRLTALPAPKSVNKDLLNLYTFTDYHLGMRAWAAESGVEWDLKIAEQMLVNAFSNMLARSPDAEVGFINQLGDFLHSDSLLPVTPSSGHVLDQSASFGEMVEAAVRVLRALVDMALRKHKKVVVLMAEGNHDMASSVWLRVMFKALYEKEPRVQVIDTAFPFYAYQHGNTMLGFHHGHKVKNEQLPGVFSAKYRLMWGTSTKVYIHVGHRHHVDEKEFNGAKVIQHPTLAASDAYSARHGYDSQQEATVITYSKKYGQVGRSTVTPEMLEAA